MNIEDDLTPATLNNIIWDVREGKAAPEDVKRLLAYFCHLVNEGQQLPIELGHFLRDGFKAYLEDTDIVSVDQGLGLVRPRQGAPPADEYEQQEIAARVLERRIDGIRHQEALEDVADEYDCGKTKVGEAWRKRKGEAIVMLTILRRVASQPDLTEAEWLRVRKIFAKDHKIMDQWFSAQPPTITPDN